MKQFKQFVYGSICIIGVSGCATFKTLDTDLPLNQRLFVYSGTRLDWSALTKNDAALEKIKVAPPGYPLLDLPFSFTLDSLFLPVSVYAEIFH
ncbi:MAG: YceK/YidQ family lipoprotein [Methylococcaceae bacterium]|nr:YceK/YidQ family lipoprotein [Methylococcaceae bacterium]